MIQQPIVMIVSTSLPMVELSVLSSYIAIPYLTCDDDDDEKNHGKAKMSITAITCREFKVSY